MTYVFCLHMQITTWIGATVFRQNLDLFASAVKKQFRPFAERFRGALYGEKFARWCACPLDYRFSYTFFIFRRFMTF